jgi:HD superfamily phosphodiesterase
MDYIGAKNYILARLERELPQHLTYHNLEHVLDVLNAVELHLSVVKIVAEDAVLLRTAALFHDSGFTIQPEEHETLSCTIAREVLPDYDYTSLQIEKICGMIMATRIPQSPNTPLEQILADADLDYLGRDDFFAISENLFTELKNRNLMNGEEEWNRMQVRFFESHHYFTAEAKVWRNAKKQEHLETIQKKLL